MIIALEKDFITVTTDGNTCTYYNGLNNTPVGRTAFLAACSLELAETVLAVWGSIPTIPDVAC